MLYLNNVAAVCSIRGDVTSSPNQPPKPSPQTPVAAYDLPMPLLSLCCSAVGNASAIALLPARWQCLCYRFAARPMAMPLLSLCCLPVGNASAIALLAACWPCLCYCFSARPSAMPLLLLCCQLDHQTAATTASTDRMVEMDQNNCDSCGVRTHALADWRLKPAP